MNAGGPTLSIMWARPMTGLATESRAQLQLGRHGGSESLRPVSSFVSSSDTMTWE